MINLPDEALLSAADVTLYLDSARPAADSADADADGDADVYDDSQDDGTSTSCDLYNM